VWGLLTALGTVGLLVRVALTEASDDPVLRPVLQKRKLAKILEASKKRRLTRTEAEDGLVLARRLGDGKAARWFSKKLRKRETAHVAVCKKLGPGLNGPSKS
jgi:hypothetical protein